MKTKSLLLTAIFSLLLVSGAWAQDKYEYATLRATINGCSPANIVFTTVDNQEIFQNKAKEADKETLKKLNELSDKGWEVYNITDSGNGCVLTYHLRKKKN
jgi:hypothetical protein